MDTNDTETHNDEAAAPAQGQRQIQREKRTAEIIKASLQVFADEGHAGYSLRKVAAVAGVRLNTVQHHFGDLRSLLLATIEAKMEDYVQRYREMVADDHTPPRARLEAALDDIFGEIRQPDVRRFFLELWALAQRDPAVGEVVKASYVGYIDAFASLATGMDPSVGRAEAMVLATMISSWTEGLVVLAQFGDAGKPSLGAVIVRMKAACMSLFGADKSPPAEAKSK